MKTKRVTKQDILKDIRAHFPRVLGEVTRIGKGRLYIALECGHGEADRIGQYAMRVYGKQVYTYYACHIFRKARLSIYFKR